jgi:beta-glucosidase
MRSQRVTLAMSLLLALAACSDETTKVVKVPTDRVVPGEIPACSATYPTGACDAGQSCLEGACVVTTALCSVSNDEGVCQTGYACYRGGCIPSEVIPDLPPLAPLDPCDVKVNTEQPELAFAPARPVGTAGAYKYNHDGDAATPDVEVPYAQKAAITVDGVQFRDLNGDGALQKYEDWRYSDVCRAKDLVTRMTVKQKVGLMSEGGTIGSGTADGVLAQNTVNTVALDHRRQALIRFSNPTVAQPTPVTPEQYGVYLNNLQALAEGLPLGIPFVVTADPVHSVGLCTNGTSDPVPYGATTVPPGHQYLCGNNGGNGSLPTAQVSHWPQPFGLGAINNTDVTFQFGDTIRREFMGLGFRWQLGPMADVATEPRWSRVQNTFGENAHHVAKHVKAEIEGFQGGRGNGGLRNGIAATMKHFPGAGPDEDGKDSHSATGKFNVFPGGMFEYHQIPFKAAIEAGAAAVMPCYSIFKVPAWEPEQVGSAHAEAFVTEYLKEQLGFDGMVTGDWGAGGGSAWGLEMFTAAEKAASFVKAGSHQLGSDSHANIQVAYDQKLLTDGDIDGAAVKILEMSFKLGLFENPYVVPVDANTNVRNETNMLAGFDAQKKALVILRNAGTTNAGRLPVSQARYSDVAGGTANAPDANEFASDSDKNGQVEVYFDGVTDALNGADQYSTFLEDYDYRAAGSGTAGTVGFTLPIVSATADTADIAVVRIAARKGTYFGLDAGVPLSFDAPLPSPTGATDGNLSSAIKDRNRVIDLFRIRDGYTKSDGTVVAPVNPALKIVLVVHIDRPTIIKPFVNGLTTLDEISGQPGSYPLVSNTANVNATVVTTGTPTAHVGVDTVVADFGAYDRAILDFVFNKHPITGFAYGSARLPVEFPSSDAAVDAQYEDVPSDSYQPTFTLGAGSNLPAN